MVKCGDSTVLFLPVHWQADVNVETEDANLFLSRITYANFWNANCALDFCLSIFFILPSYLNCLKTYSLCLAFPKLSAANSLSGIFFRLLNHTFPGALVCCNFWLIVSLSGLKYIWTGDSLVTDLRYSLPSFSCLAHKCHEVNILHLSALVSLAPFTWGHAKFSLEY